MSNEYLNDVSKAGASSISRNAQLLAEIDHVTKKARSQQKRLEKLKKIRSEYESYVERTYPDWSKHMLKPYFSSGKLGEDVKQGTNQIASTKTVTNGNEISSIWEENFNCLSTPNKEQFRSPYADFFKEKMNSWKKDPTLNTSPDKDVQFPHNETLKVIDYLERSMQRDTSFDDVKQHSRCVLQNKSLVSFDTSPEEVRSCPRCNLSFDSLINDPPFQSSPHFKQSSNRQNSMFQQPSNNPSFNLPSHHQPQQPNINNHSYVQLSSHSFAQSTRYYPEQRDEDIKILPQLIGVDRSGRLVLLETSPDRSDSRNLQPDFSQNRSFSSVNEHPVNTRSFSQATHLNDPNNVPNGRTHQSNNIFTASSPVNGELNSTRYDDRINQSQNNNKVDNAEKEILKNSPNPQAAEGAGKDEVNNTHSSIAHNEDSVKNFEEFIENYSISEPKQAKKESTAKHLTTIQNTIQNENTGQREAPANKRESISSISSVSSVSSDDSTEQAKDVSEHELQNTVGDNTNNSLDNKNCDKDTSQGSEGERLSDLEINDNSLSDKNYSSSKQGLHSSVKSNENEMQPFDNIEKLLREHNNSSPEHQSQSEKITRLKEQHASLKNMISLRNQSSKSNNISQNTDTHPPYTTNVARNVTTETSPLLHSRSNSPDNTAAMLPPRHDSTKTSQHKDNSPQHKQLSPQRGNSSSQHEKNSNQPQENSQQHKNNPEHNNNSANNTKNPSPVHENQQNDDSPKHQNQQKINSPVKENHQKNNSLMQENQQKKDSPVHKNQLKSDSPKHNTSNNSPQHFSTNASHDAISLDLLAHDGGDTTSGAEEFDCDTATLATLLQLLTQRIEECVEDVELVINLPVEEALVNTVLGTLEMDGSLENYNISECFMVFRFCLQKVLAVDQFFISQLDDVTYEGEFRDCIAEKFVEVWDLLYTFLVYAIDTFQLDVNDPTQVIAPLLMKEEYSTVERALLCVLAPNSFLESLTNQPMHSVNEEEDTPSKVESIIEENPLPTIEQEDIAKTEKEDEEQNEIEKQGQSDILKTKKHLENVEPIQNVENQASPEPKEEDVSSDESSSMSFDSDGMPVKKTKGGSNDDQDFANNNLNQSGSNKSKESSDGDKLKQSLTASNNVQLRKPGFWDDSSDEESNLSPKPKQQDDDDDFDFDFYD